MGLKKQIYEAGSGNEGEPDKLWDKQSGKLVEGTSDKVRAMAVRCKNCAATRQKSSLGMANSGIACMAIRMMIYMVKCVCSYTYGDSCVIRA